MTLPSFRVRGPGGIVARAIFVGVEIMLTPMGRANIHGCVVGNARGQGRVKSLENAPLLTVPPLSVGDVRNGNRKMSGTKMSGRRTPRELKIIRGTFRKDRNPGREIEPTSIDGPLPPPSWLGTHGRTLWETLTRELVTARVLTIVDLGALEILCSAYEVAVEAHAAIYRPGGKRRTLAAYLNGRPPRLMAEWTVMHKAWSTYRQYMLEFGFTPSSRNRIDIPGPKEPEVDPMEALLERD
jgi:P27 family predicted phage terminase small subunit